MRLAQPVMLGGVALLKEGMELTQRHIDRLASFGVEIIAVESDFLNGVPSDCPSDRQQAAGPDAPLVSGGVMGGYYAERLVRLERLFRRHADNPWMDKVRMSLEAYFLGRLALSSRRGSAGAPRR